MFLKYCNNAETKMRTPISFTFLPGVGVALNWKNQRTIHGFSDCSGVLKFKLNHFYGKFEGQLLFHRGNLLECVDTGEHMCLSDIEKHFFEDCINWHEFIIGPNCNYTNETSDDEGVCFG